MKKIIAPTIILAAFPFISHAQSFQGMFSNIVRFIDSTLIPFLFGIAFLFFVVNVFRYFILGGGNPDAQESAKSLATYGVAAFVFLIIFWGIVNMLIGSLGINSEPIRSDYVNSNRSDAPNSGNDGGLPFNALP
ncbi:hypothetical protein A3I99_02170 [Candidatus Kaiserbacteria bacterium RIFCSPLOWO2_02_FULL_45_11b]|uniref:Uncharacterized protein n=1 Tax=Candidatus Kaiserbacteria bacterium RIFCSPLOWO2_12_FULL_45_26 TaxID=1798525 RepID=A0A1F6FHN4_9BACT|nr:MAG: hypothetical protein A2Z56_04690 [Candidatus Kaiserbacteria bacterium RIFCSPHIGHO2_12_45_16]OGG70202.1 MAG: hypothetical protein A2929_03915 [Candidatus Kaiserbacteria bacterium RIFCSPLOWO2_01_FULL_45_25]OGG81869.1 MAG: hypothetical protein A3I99_02170 [Candidatus Kaiserbacteria bacterium RIFCSPLOWO2_02_FULL_45_11b]OGG85373.1 MAG: hypothetical protein A3G90_04975 [Candidatus Kaiserbacteria bacterium RIFCSPLOWO2_12_FULL_45_26]